MNGKTYVIIFGSLASFLALGDRYVMSTLYDQLMINYFLKSTVVFSILFSSFYIGYTIFQLPGGRIAHKFGPSRIIGVSLITWSLLFFLLPFTRSFSGAVGIAFLMGLAQGPIFPSVIFLLRLFYKDRQYARASGIVSAIGDLSPAIIPFATLGLFYSGMDIHLPFVVFGIVGIAAGVVLLLLKIGYTRSSEQVRWSSLLGRRYVMFGLSFLIYDYFFYIIFTWYPYFLKERFSIQSNNLVYGPLPWILMAAGSLLFGLYMDRINRDALISEISYGIVAISLVGMALSRSAEVFLVFVIISLFFLGPILLASWRLSTRLGGEKSSSLVGGWMNFWGNIGGIAAPFIFATLNDRFGLSGAFLLSVTVPILGLITWTFISRWESS
ncbi:MAG: MFS transporter [Candidatus Thermoplasmatota archaeon]|jgi:ACS family glucarate transporter-like MFS transporter|nr:MFS transporter [Candidatus Thermoplasmatota archaeon]